MPGTDATRGADVASYVPTHPLCPILNPRISTKAAISYAGPTPCSVPTFGLVSLYTQTNWRQCTCWATCSACPDLGYGSSPKVWHLTWVPLPSIIGVLCHRYGMSGTSVSAVAMAGPVLTAGVLVPGEKHEGTKKSEKWLKRGQK
eukprot:3194667-Rhodomonas_salina.2